MPKNLADINLRLATAGDEGFVQDLASEVFFAYSLDARRAIQSILRDRGTETLVADINSLHAGFVVLQYERLARDFGPWARPTVARVNAIAVRTDAHGRGIVDAFWKAPKRRREDGWLGRSRLRQTRETPGPDVSSRQGGFVELARLERYYTGGQTALLMYRALM
jgi:hypothetical protein